MIDATTTNRRAHLNSFGQRVGSFVPQIAPPRGTWLLTICNRTKCTLKFRRSQRMPRNMFGLATPLMRIIWC